MPLDITRMYSCGQEEGIAGVLVDIFKSQDVAKKPTRLQSLQHGQEPWGINCRAYSVGESPGAAAAEQREQRAGSHMRHGYNGRE